MNRDRRNRIGKLVGDLEEIMSEIDNLADEEQQAADDMPENLWGSERHEKMESNAAILQDASGDIRMVIDTINEATE